MATIIINLEAVILRCSVKKMFLKISQHSQESSRCFPVNFVKFLRTIFFIEYLWWLLLLILGGRHYHILKDISKECFKILDD